MDQRRAFPWLWVLATIVLLVVVAAAAYWLGLNHGSAGTAVGFVRPFRAFAGTRGLFGPGGLGWWLPILLLAVVIGVIVAAIARPSSRTETFEEWHRREHHTPSTATGDEIVHTEAGGPEPRDDVRPPV